MAGIGADLALGKQHQGDDWQVQEQIDLIASGDAEELPLMPVSGVNLMGDEYSGIQQEDGLHARA
ncbi:hypothetical protein RugamoR57_11360 [Duganella caerulea]